MPLTLNAVVCAVDFSTFSPLVVHHGVSLARRAGVRLYLFHAVHDPQDRLHPTTVFERGGDLTHHTDEAQKQFDTLMAHDPVDWEGVVRFGDPVEQTIAFVDSLPPSIVVSASHGISGFRRLFIGTVVERLTRAMRHPLLVVKPPDGEVGNRSGTFPSIVVSCDDHGAWQRLAPLLPLLQPGADRRIHLVHAMERPMDQSMTDSDAAPYGQAQQALQVRLKQSLHRQAQRLFPYADTLSVDVAPGVPQEMVMHAARDRVADMVAVGVRRSGKVGRWISGSTTEALLRRSPCCVLTVPEPSESFDTGGNHR